MRTPSPAPSAATDDTISGPDTELISATDTDSAAHNVCALHFAGRDYNSQPIIDVLVVSTNAVTLERALVDNSAQASLLDRSVAEAHCMAITPKWSTVGTIHEIPQYLTGEVDFFVRSVDGRETFDLKRIELLPYIPITRPPVDWDEMKHRWPHLKRIQSPHADSARVTLIIGTDVPAAHEVLDSVRAPPDKPDAPIGIRTTFGWSVLGPLDGNVSGRRVVAAITSSTNESDEEYAPEEKLVALFRSF